MIERLSRREDFRLLHRAGRRVRSRHLWLRYRPDTHHRVGYALGRALGSAVMRNRVRRRLRARVQVLARDDVLPPGDYLIGGRPGVTELSSHELEAELRALVGRLP